MDDFTIPLTAVIDSTAADQQLAEMNEQFGLNEKEWKFALRAIIQAQIDIILDEEEPNYVQAKDAFEAFVSGNLEHFTHATKPQIAQDFSLLQELLITSRKSRIYNTITNRENTNLPTPQAIRHATFNILEEICQERSISTNGLYEAKKQFVLQNNTFFIAHKQYEYDELNEVFSLLCAEYDVVAFTNTHPLLIRLLVHYAGIILQPAQLAQMKRHAVVDNYGREIDALLSPGYFYVYLNMPYTAAQQLENFYNRHKKDTIIRADDRFNGCYSYAFKINNIVEVLFSRDFQTIIRQLFKNTDILDNFRLASTEQFVTHKQLCETYNNLGRKYRFTATNCDFLEGTIATAFGVTEQFHAGIFQSSCRLENFVTHHDFYFGISLKAAEGMISAINQNFPDTATLLQSDLKNPGKPNIIFQLIQIKTEVLVSKEFTSKIESTLNDMVKSESYLIELFQKQAGLRKLLTTEITTHLSALANDNQSDERLSKALTMLSIYTAERKARPELLAASFEVAQSIAAHEAKLPTQEEYRLFKQGKKMEIKEIQKELGVLERR